MSGIHSKITRNAKRQKKTSSTKESNQSIQTVFPYVQKAKQKLEDIKKKTQIKHLEMKTIPEMKNKLDEINKLDFRRDTKLKGIAIETTQNKIHTDKGISPKEKNIS